MKIILLLALVFNFELSYSQSTTTYVVLDSNGVDLTSYQKVELNDSTTSYCKYNFTYKRLLQLLVTRHRISKNEEMISKSYRLYTVDSCPASITTRFEFMEKYPVDSLPFVEEERWDYYYKDENISKIELIEHGRFTQVRAFELTKNLCHIRYHTVRNDTIVIDPYSKDSIVISKRGKQLDRYHFRWDKVYELSSHMNRKKRSVYRDTTVYTEYKYHVNNWDLNDHLISMMAGEGALYSMRIAELDEQINSRKAYPDKNESVEIKRKTKFGRTQELIYFIDGKIVSRIKYVY